MILGHSDKVLIISNSLLLNLLNKLISKSSIEIFSLMILFKEFTLAIAY